MHSFDSPKFKNAAQEIEFSGPTPGGGVRSTFEQFQGGLGARGQKKFKKFFSDAGASPIL